MYNIKIEMTIQTTNALNELKNKLSNIPIELNNYIYSFVGKHQTSEFMYDLIENCYNQETSQDKITFSDWYFNYARPKYYCGISNRYGNREYLFDIVNYYNNYLFEGEEDDEEE